MKKHFSQLLLIIPLLLIASITFAAYNFTGPTAAPTSNNTDGPLNDSTTDQVKSGGLSVNTFTANDSSYFNQNAIFTGHVFGGTPINPTAPVSFGNSSETTGVAITGTQSITGTYQSDSLKTGGGEKPLCADKNGQFYICATPATTTATQTTPTIVLTTTEVGGSYEVGANISYPVSSTIEVYINENGPNATNTSAVSMLLNALKNHFTSYAVAQGVCYPPSGSEALGSVEITDNTKASWNTVPLSPGCTPSDVSVSISRISPTVASDGTKIDY